MGHEAAAAYQLFGGPGGNVHGGAAWVNTLLARNIAVAAWCGAVLAQILLAVRVGELKKQGRASTCPA